MDAPLVTGIFTLAGATLGAAVSFLTAQRAAATARAQATEDHLRTRRDETRQHASDAFALALESVTWLRDEHVPYTVLEEQQRDTYEPLYLANIEKLRESKRTLLRLAATTEATISGHAEETAHALMVLDDAWEGARTWRAYMRLDPPPAVATSSYELELQRIVAARERLTGFGTTAAGEEADHGGLAGADCLLARLRDEVREL